MPFSCFWNKHGNYGKMSVTECRTVTMIWGLVKVTKTTDSMFALAC